MGSVWGAPSGQILGFEAQGRRDAGSSRPRGLLSSILPSYRSYSVTRLAVYCTMLPRLDTASPRMEATPPHPRVNPRAMEGRGSKRTTDGGGHTAGVPCTSAQVRPVLENPLWLPSPARRRRSSPYPPPPLQSSVPTGGSAQSPARACSSALGPPPAPGCGPHCAPRWLQVPGFSSGRFLVAPRRVGRPCSGPAPSAGHPTSISRAHPFTPTSLLPSSSPHEYLVLPSFSIHDGSPARKLIPRFRTASSVEHHLLSYSIYSYCPFPLLPFAISPCPSLVYRGSVAGRKQRTLTLGLRRH